MQYKFKDTPHKAQNAFDEGLYSFRKSPNVLDGAYDRLLLNKVVGGTLAVNQLCNPTDGSGTASAVAWAINGGKFTATGTASASNNITIKTGVPVIANHVYVLSNTGQHMPISSSNAANLQFVSTNFNLAIAENKTDNSVIGKASATETGTIRNRIQSGATYSLAYYPQLFDLTQMFGSTIADYVYNLEQSTAGSGVAWLKQYYPSIFNSYQPYNAGTLESVETSAHVMTGFNQFDEEVESGFIDVSTGANVSSDTRYRSKNYIKILPNTNYYFKSPAHAEANNAGHRFYYYDENKSFITSPQSTTHLSQVFTTPSNAFYMRFFVNEALSNYNDDICINVSSDRNGEYEAYTQTSYPLDSDLVLRGIPKISNGVPYYDGDEYKSDGTVTRKYGEYTFTGSETWTWSATINAWITSGITGLKTTATTIRASNGLNCNCYVNGQLRVYSTYNPSITSSTDMNTMFPANSGLLFSIDETTETADPYTNPQVCYSDGTEEFTDWKVAAGSRDISLPVQCESMYYEAVPLPTEALSINGKFIEDVIDGYRTLNVTGRETMAQEIKEAEVGKHDGAFFQYRRYPTRDIVVKYQIIAESNEAYRNAFIKLNQMLDFSEGVLIFNDETDKCFVGTPTDVELPEPGLNCAVGEFTLHCEDPFKYSVQEKGVDMQSDANGYFFELGYKGTHKSYPRIETDFYNTDTEDDSNGECSFISFMKTDGKILLFGDPENTDANRAPVRIFQRASSAPAVPSSQVTFSFESQTVTNPSALGSWSTTIPSGESTLWTTMAIAESTATNAYINQADWGTVEQYANQDDSALYSINSKTEVNKKFTSQGTAWASNSGKIYNNWPETGTPGIVTPPGGNKYITASGYGSGSDWHGPSVTRTKSDDIRDFLFTFNYAFYQGTGDQAAKQTGLLQAVLWNSTQSKIIAALSFWKNSGNSKGSIRMVVGGKSVKTLSEVPFGIQTQTVTTDANACSIKKIGSTVIFNVKGTEYRFVDESIKETATDKVTFYFAKKGTTTAMDEIGVHSAQLIKYYQPVSPNPFTSNDELRIDTKNTAVQLNGLDAQGIGALANDWEGFYLKPGINLIGVVWSEYVPSTYKPTCRLYYREVYL